MSGVYHLPSVIVQSDLLQQGAHRKWGTLTTACGRNGEIHSREHSASGQGEFFSDSKLCDRCGVAWDVAEEAGALGRVYLHRDVHQWNTRGAVVEFEPLKNEFSIAVILRERFPLDALLQSEATRA